MSVVVEDERPLRGARQGLGRSGRRREVTSTGLGRRFGAEDDRLAGQVDLVADRLARVAQDLEAVEQEEREADVLEPVGVEVLAVQSAKVDDRVGVALAGGDERERALVALDQDASSRGAARRRWP